jgi:hypothetical protein
MQDRNRRGGRSASDVRVDPARFNETFRHRWLSCPAGAPGTLAATRKIINGCHITFVKGRFASDDAATAAAC